MKGTAKRGKCGESKQEAYIGYSVARSGSKHAPAKDDRYVLVCSVKTLHSRDSLQRQDLRYSLVSVT
jgi:hypothetical protein